MINEMTLAPVLADLRDEYKASSGDYMRGYADGIDRALNLLMMWRYRQGENLADEMPIIPTAIKLAVTYTLWRAVKAPNGYIADDELKQCVKNILVTYETPTGQRKVRSVFCDHGRCGKIVNGKVVAWMPLPEAYREGEA